MATEEQIKELAFALWEQEGRPHGKDEEHYFRAKQILEKREETGVIELGAAERHKELSPPSDNSKPKIPSTKKRSGTTRRQKK